MPFILYWFGITSDTRSIILWDINSLDGAQAAPAPAPEPVNYFTAGILARGSPCPSPPLPGWPPVPFT